MNTDRTLRTANLMVTMDAWTQPGAVEQAEDPGALETGMGPIGDAGALETGMGPIGDAGALPSARAAGAEPDGPEEANLDMFFDQIEDVIGFLRKAMSKMASENRTLRNAAAKEALAAGLGAADEIGAQAEDTMKAAEKQAKGMTIGGIIKFIAITVALAIIGFCAPGASAGALTAICLAAGLVAGLGAATAEIYQGARTKEASRDTKAASMHEQARSELQAFGEKLRHEKDQRSQDYSQTLQLLDDAQELAKELRALVKQNGFT